MRARLQFALVAVLSLAGAPASAQPAAPDVPRVTFAVTPLLDGPCARLTGAAPDTVATRELRGRFEEFLGLWAAQGPPLLRAAVEATGRPFAFGETIAAMHLCPGLASMSLPLLVSMRRYLRTPPAGELADSLARFPAVVFHELLHRYVVDLIGSEPATPLWRKYAAEPAVVRWHLHLMAIEEVAFRRAGRERELASVHTDYRRWPSYQRAREIVEAEGVEAFLAELRALR
ncbi:MAG TPA: hypothetical protein VNA89_02055 [Gemmatimonadaceae bacterium]|nr:hypothetical protein [Gemmatimonadaceae bacterium]